MENRILLNPHEERLNQIQQRVTTLLASEIKNLLEKINTAITSGSIDEGIANALAKNESEYIVINEPYNKNINYDFVFREVIKTLKYLYEPTYKVNGCRYSYGSPYVYNGESYRISIVFEGNDGNTCIIL